MSLRDLSLCLEDKRRGRIVKPECQAIFAPQPFSNKYNLLRAASAMHVDFSNLGSVSGKKYLKPLGEPVCVFGFEKTLSAGKINRIW